MVGRLKCGNHVSFETTPSESGSNRFVAPSSFIVVESMVDARESDHCCYRERASRRLLHVELRGAGETLATTEPNSDSEKRVKLMQRERIPITKEGLEKLQAEYDDLVNRRRPEVVRAIQLAREEGDLRENAGYDAAKHDQGFIEARIREIEQLLRSVDVIDSEETATANGGVVRLGSTVTVEIDGLEETYTIVGKVEAKPLEGKISNESPVGRSLLGHRIGQTVTVETPGATMSARIVSVDG